MTHGVRAGVSLRAFAIAGAAALVASLGACTPADGITRENDASTVAAETSMRYVAMGDSYTSAPGIAGENSPDGCLRSPRNYPAMVAAALEVDELVDVSCSGSQTLHMTREHVTDASVKPPQLDALDEGTDLVTLSIGANDYGLFGTLVHRCTAMAAEKPKGSPCADHLGSRGWDQPTMQIARIRDRVAGVVADIQSRAPRARVIVVGYPQLIPAKGRCNSRIPLAIGDHAYVRTHLAGLSESIKAGAEFAGAEFVDLIAASDGHDVCSKRPWMNGAVEKPDRASPYHPYPVEQRAVADLIVSRVGAA